MDSSYGAQQDNLFKHPIGNINPQKQRPTTIILRNDEEAMRQYLGIKEMCISPRRRDAILPGAIKLEEDVDSTFIFESTAAALDTKPVHHQRPSIKPPLMKKPSWLSQKRTVAPLVCRVQPLQINANKDPAFQPTVNELKEYQQQKKPEITTEKLDEMEKSYLKPEEEYQKKKT